MRYKSISIHALREEGDLKARVEKAKGEEYFYPRPPRGGRLAQNRGIAQHRYFYPRPPRGGRQPRPLPLPAKGVFLSTPSARRATHGGRGKRGLPGDFYPRPPRGGRLDGPVTATKRTGFLSTPSARRATSPERYMTANHCGFLSTPSARRATHGLVNIPEIEEISIHALREEGDVPRPLRQFLRRDISIHALREEGDLASSTASPYSVRFLSTPSARRATNSEQMPFLRRDEISIHALREEGDCT